MDIAFELKPAHVQHITATREMIYLCQACGWRINQRINTTPERVGTHLLYKHMAFCSEYCIALAKANPRILSRTVVPSDWDEQGYIEEGVFSNWKTDRKRNKQKAKV
jgi:hypothetical protein